MRHDWATIDRDKKKSRAQAADRPIVEKLRVLDRLRDRAAEIKRAAANAASSGRRRG
jgi:hypothetical protein